MALFRVKAYSDQPSHWNYGFFNRSPRCELDPFARVSALRVLLALFAPEIEIGETTLLKQALLHP